MELAVRAGISQRLVSSIESGDRVGSLETWRSLSEALGVNVGWLSGEVAVREPSEGGVAAILTDESSPPGLRALATDQRMADALQITDDEWDALRSMKPPGVLTEQAYLAVLYAIRSDVKST
jgi:transcriptional regulator with XRE-family HTH domain